MPCASTPLASTWRPAATTSIVSVSAWALPTVIVSELITGRVMLDVAFPDVIQEIRWNPAQDYSDVLAVACGSRVYFLDTELSGDEEKHARCQELLHSSRHVRVT